MKASALERLLIACFAARYGVAIEGDPGGGKTTIVIAAAKSAGQELIIEHPSIADPTDYKGLPVMQKDGSAKFAPIGLIARLLTIKKPTVVFADDFGQAAHATQAAFMQLVHGGRLNDVQLRTDLITWILATNGTGDRAAVIRIALVLHVWRNLKFELDGSGGTEAQCRAHELPLEADTRVERHEHRTTPVLPALVAVAGPEQGLNVLHLENFALLGFALGHVHIHGRVLRNAPRFHGPREDRADHLQLKGHSLRRDPLR